LATYSTDKYQISSAFEAGQKYGFGSPIHLAALEVIPPNGDGVGSIPVIVHPLEDGYGSTTAAGDVTPSGTATEAKSYKLKIGGILSEAFSVPAGAVVVADVVASMITAVNAVSEMPVIAADGTTKMDLSAKWAGETGNDIDVELVLVGDAVGVVFTIVQPTGGTVNPTVTAALDQIGNVWETMLVNCLNISDTDALDEYSTFGETRWGTLVKKPLVVFTGNTATTVSAATVESDARTTDRTNAQLVEPGSTDLPCRVAARQLARIAVVANNNPPTNYNGQRATGLVPGDDGDQWDYANRDAALKAGSSTIEVRGGVTTIGDVVTFYHPDGEPNPAYRYVVDIVKLQNIIYNINLIFASANWEGMPLVADDQPVVNPNARRPKDAKAAVNGLLDSLGEQAIIADAAAAKKKTTASIDSGNPKRLNAAATVELSGNAGIISVDLDFGFYFGQAAAA